MTAAVPLTEEDQAIAMRSANRISRWVRVENRRRVHTMTGSPISLTRMHDLQFRAALDAANIVPDGSDGK